MIEFIRCQVLFPHTREFGGQLMMLEPMFSGNLAIPHDDLTKEAIKRAWLKPVSEPFMAEPNFPVT